MFNPIRAARDIIARRHTAYKATFLGPQGRYVLADLYRFAGGHKLPFNHDIRQQDIMLGRKEMLERIRHFTELSPTELMRLYTAEAPEKL